MIETLKDLDTEVLLFLNSFHTTFFDNFFLVVTHRFTWIPFYALLLFFAWKKYGSQVWKFMIAVALLIVCADQLSVFVKDYVQRYRPCHHIVLQHLLHLVEGRCGGTFGFVSSHATNSMALAVFTCLTLFRDNKRMTYAMITYTLLVSYSRIYLGMHYPLDILGGFLLGAMIAHGMYIFSKSNKLA